MRRADSVETRGAQVAAFTSMLLIAQQVAGKAARDALFLSSFHATSLPFAMGAGALLSLAGVYGLSQWMARSTPAAIMPALFSISSAAFVFAWLVAQSAPRPAAVLVYLQTALLSPLMISTFWSLINERFDPHTAKRAVARISGGGTLGGVLGGLAVWRASKLVQPATVLLLLAALNALAVVGTLLTRARRAPEEALAAESQEAAPSPLALLRKAAFLRNLALLVALSAAISALLDYLLSAEAVASLGKGQALLGFFSLFWLSVAIVSFFVQMLIGKLAIEKLSLAINIAILPGIIVLGGTMGLAVPGLLSSALLRGAEAVQRNTLFRSAYELLYTPVPEASKRVTKAVIDVGFDRVGTIVGSGIALTILGSALRPPDSMLLVAVTLLALAALPLARRLHAGYVAALQEGLRVAAAKVEATATDDESRSSLGPDTHRPLQEAREELIERVEDLQPGGLSALVDEELAREHESPERDPAQLALESPQAMLNRVRQLLSGDELGIERGLKELDSRGPGVACAILLLSQPAHHERALQALRGVAESVTGQLLDALLDPSMDFRVRRRLPRALDACRTQRAADGLLLGLADERFEVRYACARALAKITDGETPITIPQEKVVEAIRREVQSGKRIVERSTDDDGDPSTMEPLVTGLVLDRVDRSLEHVFRILSLVFEREHLRLAFNALHHEDSKDRGTALEYLDSVLPAEIRDLIWPYLGETVPLPAARPTQELLADIAEAK
jgi:ATP/ADP translocase